MAYVNYITERESFIRHARDNGYTGNEQLLWHALFTIFNERAGRNAFAWPDGFIRISNKELLSWLPFTEKTLVPVRADLVNPNRHQPVLVEYLKGRRNAEMPQYKMRWFTEHTENPQSYRNLQGNMGGNLRGNMGDNMEGNPWGNTGSNMGDITVNINQTQQQANLRVEKKICYNQAWRTDGRARRAVAQNILDAVQCEGIAPNANEEICYYLEQGMTPEQALTALDGIRDARFVGGWLHTAAVGLGLEKEDDEWQSR